MLAIFFCLLDCGLAFRRILKKAGINLFGRQLPSSLFFFLRTGLSSTSLLLLYFPSYMALQSH